MVQNNPEQPVVLGAPSAPSAETGVGWHFSASHYDEVRRELHGHSYEVVAWFKAVPPSDAVTLQETLKGALRAFDHKTLDAPLNTAEGLARAFLRLLDGCIGVDVSRPVERLYARVRI